MHGLAGEQSWHLLKPVDVDKVLDAWAAWWHWPQGEVNPRFMPGLEPGYVPWMCKDPNELAPDVHCDTLLGHHTAPAAAAAADRSGIVGFRSGNEQQWRRQGSPRATSYIGFVWGRT